MLITTASRCLIDQTMTKPHHGRITHGFARHSENEGTYLIQTRDVGLHPLIVQLVDNARSSLLPGTYAHYKSTPSEPKLYTVHGLALDSADHALLVWYTPRYLPSGTPMSSIRPAIMWQEEIFHNGVFTPRFALVKGTAPASLEMI